MTDHPAAPGFHPEPHSIDEHAVDQHAVPAPPARAQRPRIPATLAAIAGIVAAAAALAAGELIAGFVGAVPSPLSAVGSAVIDFAPPGSKDFVVSLFGTNDKLALLAVVYIAVLVFGAAIGLVARVQRNAGGIVAVALVAVGGLAALREPTAIGPLVVVASAIEAAVGLQVLVTLLNSADTAETRDRGAAWTHAGPTEAVRPAEAIGAPNRGRRAFLEEAGVIGIVAVLGGGFGRLLLAGRAGAAADASLLGGSGSTGTVTPPVKIPQAVDPAPSPGPDASLAVPGLTPVVVPSDQFYRIDTAFFPPSVDLSTWNLHVFGMVDKEVRLTFAELVQLPLIERYVTIACVSNEVGGNLVGNAKWTGPRLADVLAMAGVQAGATQVVPRSVDGWTAGFPTAWLHDPAHPRDAIIAVKMNDAPLPVEHGFPARLIVPGLYGYVSATKWLSEIELTTLEAFDAYWVPRGWAKEAPILTQSRIDVPQNQGQVHAGPVAVAGVAWAPDRGISRVEVRVDGGPWQQARLATELSPATWVQWAWTWQATSGQHVLEVRATDGTGQVQTDRVTPPDPDGARGHHQIAVSVG